MSTAQVIAPTIDLRESGIGPRPGLNLVHPDPILTAYRHSMPAGNDPDSPLHQAIQSVLAHPGGLHRARLSHHLALAFGADNSAALQLATALEYFHTASLIFDDLPCMDNADMRRGVACVHKTFGEHEAILAALALINRAYALAWQAMLGCSRVVAIDAIEYLEGRLGISGLLQGQSADLNYANLPHSAEMASSVARGKTVSLIQLSLVWPALLFGADNRDICLLERLSLYWGLAYQAADDLKDILQSAAQSGKTSARDVLLDRPNIAASLGLEPTAQRLARLVRLGDQNLAMLLRKRPSLHFLAEFRNSLTSDIASLAQAEISPLRGTQA